MACGSCGTDLDNLFLVANSHRGIKLEPPSLLEGYHALGKALYAEWSTLAAKAIKTQDATTIKTQDADPDTMHNSANMLSSGSTLRHRSSRIWRRPRVPLLCAIPCRLFQLFQHGRLVPQAFGFEAPSSINQRQCWHRRSTIAKSTLG